MQSYCYAKRHYSEFCHAAFCYADNSLMIVVLQSVTMLNVASQKRIKIFRRRCNETREVEAPQYLPHI